LARGLSRCVALCHDRGAVVAYGALAACTLRVPDQAGPEAGRCRRRAKAGLCCMSTVGRSPFRADMGVGAECMPCTRIASATSQSRPAGIGDAREGGFGGCCERSHETRHKPQDPQARGPLSHGRGESERTTQKLNSAPFQNQILGVPAPVLRLAHRSLAGSCTQHGALASASAEWSASASVLRRSRR
jgi:hypothetical protein